jgi:hypothetical protein
MYGLYSGTHRLQQAESCGCLNLVQLKGRLMHSSLFGSHILGAVKTLAELAVEKDDDIDRIIEEIIDAKLLASQVRLLVAKASLEGRAPCQMKAYHLNRYRYRDARLFRLRCFLRKARIRLK